MNDNTDNDNADKINRCADAAAGKLPWLIINQVCKEIKAVGNAILPDENDHPTVSIAFNIDCMEYMKNIPDKHFDLAIVDPPYGIGKDWKKRNKGDNTCRKTSDTFQRAVPLPVGQVVESGAEPFCERNRRQIYRHATTGVDVSENWRTATA